MSSCRSCGAHIIWARTERGKKMPLDAAPVTTGEGPGQFVLRERESVEGPLAIAAWGLPLDDPHHVSHFATCPNADSHRNAQ